MQATRASAADLLTLYYTSAMSAARCLGVYFDFQRLLCTHDSNKSKKIFMIVVFVAKSSAMLVAKPRQVEQKIKPRSIAIKRSVLEGE